MAKKAETKQLHKPKVSSSFFQKYLFELIVVVFSFVLYTNSILNDYNLDDELVTINHKLTSKGISAIPEIFSSPYYSDASGYAYEYRPMVLATYAIEHSIFGDNAHVSHFFNIIFYCVCCLILYRLLLTVFKESKSLIALTVTLIFVAHPAHTEIVCSAKNRDEIMGLLFSLLAMLYVFSAIDTGKIWKLFLASFVFALALMCKITFLPFAVIAPLSVILFTEVGLGYVMLVGALFILPSYFLLDIDMAHDKIAIEFILLGAVAILFGLLRPISISASWFRKPSFLQQSNGVQMFSGLGNFFEGVIPPVKYFLSVEGVSTLFLAIVFAMGFKWNISLLMMASLALLMILTFAGNEKLNLWAKTFLYLCITAALLNVFTSPNAVVEYQDFVVGTAFIVLCYELFFGKAFLRIPVIVCLLALTALLIFSYHGIGRPNFVLVFLFFLALRNGKSKPGLVIIGLVALAALINIGYLGYRLYTMPQRWYIYFPHFISLAVAAGIYFNRGTRYVLAIIVLLIYFFISPVSPVYFNKPSVSIDKSVEETVNHLSVKVYDGKTDRPLGYIENPMAPSDSWELRTGTSLIILSHYLYKVVLPYPMAFYYGYSFIKPEKINTITPLISLGLYLLLGALAVILARKHKMISLGLWIYLLSVVVYSNYRLPVPGLLAERFLLVPSLGWAIVFTSVIFYLFKFSETGEPVRLAGIPNGLKYTLGGVLCLYSVITFSRNFDWKDKITLMRKDLKYVDQSAQGHNLLALNIMKRSVEMPASAEQQELWKEALMHFKKSLQIYPGTFNVAYDAGRVSSMLNMVDTGLYYFKLADAMPNDRPLPALQMNIATIYQQKGMNDSAIYYYGKYIRLLPTAFDGYDKLAFLLYHMGQPEKALDVCLDGVKQVPGDYRIYFNTARSYIATKQMDSALVYLLKAQQLNPSDQQLNQAVKDLSGHR